MILRRVVKHRIPIPDIANSKMKMFYIVHKIMFLRIVLQSPKKRSITELYRALTSYVRPEDIHCSYSGNKGYYDIIKVC